MLIDLARPASSIKVFVGEPDLGEIPTYGHWSFVRTYMDVAHKDFVYAPTFRGTSKMQCITIAVSEHQLQLSTASSRIYQSFPSWTFCTGIDMPHDIIGERAFCGIERPALREYCIDTNSSELHGILSTSSRLSKPSQFNLRPLLCCNV